MTRRNSREPGRVQVASPVRSEPPTPDRVTQTSGPAVLKERRWNTAGTFTVYFSLCIYSVLKHFEAFCSFSHPNPPGGLHSSNPPPHSSMAPGGNDKRKETQQAPVLVPLVKEYLWLHFDDLAHYIPWQRAASAVSY